MGQRLLSLVLLGVFATAGAFTAFAQGDSRLALLIANANYPDADTPLAPVIQDARALADELRRNGFEVDVAENLNKEAMRRAVDGFYGKIKSNSTAMIFFSGYGIQTGRQSYLIPVNAQIWTDAEVKRDGFSIDAILSEMNARGASAKIAVVDASRRNPFERRFRGVSSGLATVILPRGSLVMYATGPGTVIADTDSKSSLFVGELLKEMRAPGIPVEEVFNRTRSGVARASKSEQVPWISSSLLPTDDVYFSQAPRPAPTIAATTTTPSGSLSGTAESPPPRPAPTPAPAPAAQETEARLDYELAERIGTRKAWDDFLVRHKTSSYADRARDQLAKLDAPRPAPVPTPPPVTTVPPRVTTAPPPPPPPPPPVAAAPATTPPPIPAPPATQPKPAEPVIAALTPEDRAMRDLDRAIEQNANDGDAYYKRGLALAQKGQFARAIGDFDQAIRANPSDAEAFNNRCFVRAVLNELQRALQDCNDSLRLRPNFIDALDSRGLVKLKIGAAKDAIVDYDAALKINPRHAAALFGRGKAKQKIGDTRGGNADLAAARGVQSDIAEEFEGYGVR